jgi:ankyrin repeat protein
LLIDEGVDVNAHDDEGFTALMYASGEVGWYRRNVNPEVVQEIVNLLIEEGADVNAQGVRGETALDLANLSGHKEVAELLKEAGAKE